MYLFFVLFFNLLYCFSKPRTIFEIIVLLFSICLILNEIRSFFVQGLKVYFKTLKTNPFKIFLFISLISNMIMIPFRLTCFVYGEDIFSSICIISLGLYSFYFGRFDTIKLNSRIINLILNFFNFSKGVFGLYAFLFIIFMI
jgi:hypothetical protein